MPTTPTHTDWRRALEEAPDDGGRIEREARALAVAIIAVATRELGDQEAEVRSHGALIRAGENVCRLGDARRGEICDVRCTMSATRRRSMRTPRARS